MGMALKVDVKRACIQAGTAKPIDLAHLSAMTMGDRVLEADVLEMFSAQLDAYKSQMATAEGEEAYRLAHAIKGAANNVGAFGLAEMARTAETEKTFDVPVFHAEIEAIQSYILELRDSAQTA